MKLKKIFDKQNILYTLILLILVVILVVNRAINKMHNIIWIADFGTLFGVLYAIAAAKNNNLMFVFNIISTLIIGTTSYIQHLYFSTVLCFFINTPIAIYGLVSNLKKSKKASAIIKTLSKKQLFWVLSILAVSITVMTIVLKLIGSNLFYLDAIGSSCVLVGLLLMSGKYIEQFYFFMVANITYIAIYIILSVNNPNNLVYILMYIIFTITNILGILNWKKQLKMQQKD